MNNKKYNVKDVTFFTGEASTGKTFVANQLERYLKVNNNLKIFVLHLGDWVRRDQKAEVEPAFSMKEKTDNKILLNKDEISKLMEHYISNMPQDTEYLMVEGFPRTKDDVDLMMSTLKNEYYNKARLSLVNLSFKDSGASIGAMQTRQEDPRKYRYELSDIDEIKKKHDNYLNSIKPAVEYFVEKYADKENAHYIDLELENNEFWENYKELDGNNSVFKKLIRELPYNSGAEKISKEIKEKENQFKINFK